MRKIQVCLQGGLDTTFELDWPETAHLPRAGESISLDGPDSRVFVQIQDVMHSVGHGSVEVEVSLYGTLLNEFTKDRLVFELKEIPSVGEVFY